MTEEQIQAAKARIDLMTQLEMARLWRYAPAGHPYFNRRLPLAEYFQARFDKLGGFNSRISKAIDQ